MQQSENIAPKVHSKEYKQIFANYVLLLMGIPFILFIYNYLYLMWIAVVAQPSTLASGQIAHVTQWMQHDQVTYVPVLHSKLADMLPPLAEHLFFPAMAFAVMALIAIFVFASGVWIKSHYFRAHLRIQKNQLIEFLVVMLFLGLASIHPNFTRNLIDNMLHQNIATMGWVLAAEIFCLYYFVKILYRFYSGVQALHMEGPVYYGTKVHRLIIVALEIVFFVCLPAMMYLWFLHG